MTTPLNNLHTLPQGYFSMMMVLATCTATYGVLNLSSVAFRISGYKPHMGQSDKLVIGFFNVVISAVAICTIFFIAR